VAFNVCRRHRQSAARDIVLEELHIPLPKQNTVVLAQATQSQALICWLAAEVPKTFNSSPLHLNFVPLLTLLHMIL